MEFAGHLQEGLFPLIFAPIGLLELAYLVTVVMRCMAAYTEELVVG